MAFFAVANVGNPLKFTITATLIFSTVPCSQKHNFSAVLTALTLLILCITCDRGTVFFPLLLSNSTNSKPNESHCPPYICSVHKDIGEVIYFFSNRNKNYPINNEPPVTVTTGGCQARRASFAIKYLIPIL